LFSLLATILDFAQACSLHDDLTLLVIRRRDAVKSEQGRTQTTEFSAPSRRLPRARQPRRQAGEDTVPKR
jgi:hypothetical protein